MPQADIEWIISNGKPRGVERQPAAVEALRHPGQGAAAPVGGDPEGDGRRRQRARAREYDVYPKEFTPVYDARRKLVGKQLYTLLGVPRGDAAGMLKQFRKNYDFFDAPVGMILCVERRMGNGQWIDCGIFLDQLMLLAREKGLHTCPQAAFSRYQHVVRRELKIPDDQVVICGLALGYADPDAVPNNLITERAPLAGLHDLVTMTDRLGLKPEPKSNCRGGDGGLKPAVIRGKSMREEIHGR